MFAAFHLPDLPVTAALRHEPQWRDHPCGVLREPTARDDGKIPLLALNSAARHTGISPGWQLGRALVRCPDLRLLSRHPETEATLLAELVTLAESFTPDVEVASPDTVLLDLSGTPASQIAALQPALFGGLEACHALAETPDLAHFAALDPRTRGRLISSEEIRTLPLSLLGRLDAAETFLPQLDLLGMRTMGDFLRLPRQGLAERFGLLAGHWHEVISGKNRRLLKLHRPPESLAQSLDFDDAINSSEALVFVFRRLLQVLGSRLAARHLAASVLEIRLRLEVGDLRREIRLPEPLADPAALLTPLQTLAESLVLPSPVIGIELDATAAIPLSRQSDWTQRQLPDPERWSDTLARLEGLLGSGRVGIPTPLTSHRPDAFEMRVSPHAASLPPACSLPLRRFRPPLAVAVAFESTPGHPRPLALLTGPHPGEVLAQRGPFPSSGDAWDPGSAWQRLEWDVQVDRAPLLRLVFQPADHWQIEGIYG